MESNTVYEWLKFWYGKGVTESHCRTAVSVKKINQTQFKEITDKDF